MAGDERLAGQVVLVTGSGKNLGRTVAVEAASRGAAVGVLVRQDLAAAEAVVGEITDAGRRATALVGDVAVGADVDRMVATCTDALGPITSVVHAAAHRSIRPFLELSLDEWRRTTAVSLDAAYFLARAALPGMVDGGFGRFVFVGGAAMNTGLPLGYAHVACAKAGLRGFVRALAREAGRHGVTANVVSPGAIVSEASARERQPASSAVTHWGAAAEVTAACLFLCEREARIITGQTLSTDGGMFAFGL